MVPLCLVHALWAQFLMYKNNHCKKYKNVQPEWITCWWEYSLSPLQCLSPEWSSWLLLLLHALLLAELPLLLLLLLLLPCFFPSAEEAAEDEDELERRDVLGSAQRPVPAVSYSRLIRFVRRRVLFEASKNSWNHYECIACSVMFPWLSEKRLTTGFQGNRTSCPHTLQNLYQNSLRPIPPSPVPCFPMPVFHNRNPWLHYRKTSLMLKVSYREHIVNAENLFQFSSNVLVWRCLSLFLWPWAWHLNYFWSCFGSCLNLQLYYVNISICMN